MLRILLDARIIILIIHPKNQNRKQHKTKQQTPNNFAPK
jgi:hypothetical protein